MALKFAKRGNFPAAIKRFRLKIRVMHGNTVTAVARETFLTLARLSPVDTGRFRDSWRIGISVPDLETETARKPSPQHRPPLATPPALPEAVKGRAKQFRHPGGFPTVWITNDIAYGLELETGKSDQAPEGFVGAAVASVKLKIRAGKLVVRQVK